MDNILQSFVQIWWLLENVDQQTIVNVIVGAVTLIASSEAVAWVLQHWKRSRSIDLKKRGKALILGVLSALSGAVSVADWYVLNYPTHLPVWVVGAGSVVFTLATILHRLHVSPMYPKLTGVLRSLADQIDAARSAKYAAPVEPPAAVPFTFEK